MGAPIVEYFAYTVTTPMATLAALIVSKDCPCEWHENSVQAPLHRCTGCASQMDQTAFALGRTPGESATRPTGSVGLGLEMETAGTREGTEHWGLVTAAWLTEISGGRQDRPKEQGAPLA